MEKYKLLHQLALESRNDHFRCLALVGSADAKLGLNDNQEALKDAIEAEQIAEDFDPNGGDFGLACRILGEVWEQLGEYETAQRYLKNAEMGQLSWGDLKRTRDALKRVKAKLKSGG